jgi:hypothetical protein
MESTTRISTPTSSASLFSSSEQQKSAADRTQEIVFESLSDANNSLAKASHFEKPQSNLSSFDLLERGLISKFPEDRLLELAQDFLKTDPTFNLLFQVSARAIKTQAPLNIITQLVHCFLNKDPDGGYIKNLLFLCCQDDKGKKSVFDSEPANMLLNAFWNKDRSSESVLDFLMTALANDPSKATSVIEAILLRNLSSSMFSQLLYLLRSDPILFDPYLQHLVSFRLNHHLKPNNLSLETSLEFFKSLRAISYISKGLATAFVKKVFSLPLSQDNLLFLLKTLKIEDREDNFNFLDLIHSKMQSSVFEKMKEWGEKVFLDIPDDLNALTGLSASCLVDLYICLVELEKLMESKKNFFPYSFVQNVWDMISYAAEENDEGHKIYFQGMIQILADFPPQGTPAANFLSLFHSIFNSIFLETARAAARKSGEKKDLIAFERQKAILDFIFEEARIRAGEDAYIRAGEKARIGAEQVQDLVDRIAKALQFSLIEDYDLPMLKPFPEQVRKTLSEEEIAYVKDSIKELLNNHELLAERLIKKPLMSTNIWRNYLDQDPTFQEQLTLLKAPFQSISSEQDLPEPAKTEFENYLALLKEEDPDVTFPIAKEKYMEHLEKVAYENETVNQLNVLDSEELYIPSSSISSDSRTSTDKQEAYFKDLISQFKDKGSINTYAVQNVMHFSLSSSRDLADLVRKKILDKELSLKEAYDLWRECFQEHLMIESFLSKDLLEESEVFEECQSSLAFRFESWAQKAGISWNPSLLSSLPPSLIAHLQLCLTTQEEDVETADFTKALFEILDLATQNTLYAKVLEKSLARLLSNPSLPNFFLTIHRLMLQKLLVKAASSDSEIEIFSVWKKKTILDLIFQEAKEFTTTMQVDFSDLLLQLQSHLQSDYDLPVLPLPKSFSPPLSMVDMTVIEDATLSHLSSPEVFSKRLLEDRLGSNLWLNHLKKPYRSLLETSNPEEWKKIYETLSEEQRQAFSRHSNALLQQNLTTFKERKVRLNHFLSQSDVPEFQSYTMQLLQEKSEK